MFDIDDQRAEKIAKSFHIPAQPLVLQQLQLEQAKEDPCPLAFADVIVKDVALSASVLKTVNSPLFGLNRTVTDIKQSVMLLGTSNINTLVTFFQLEKSFSKPRSITLEKYWDLAMETANMVRIVMDHLQIESTIQAEDAYAFALFRDCGIALMAGHYDDYKEVLIEANNSPNRIFTDVEESHYQTNHAIVGYFLACAWHLPESLCQYILRHHDLSFLDSPNISEHDQTLYALIQLASNVLNKYKYLKDDPEWLLSHDKVLHFFHLSDIDYHELEEDLKDNYEVQFG